MADWYKHDIAAWMDGTEHLDDGSYRVYHVVCQLIYLNEGPIRINEHGIAGRCRQPIRSFRANLGKLVELGLLTASEGRLSNSRAKKELEKIGENRLNASKGGKARSKSLENNDQSQASLQRPPALRLDQTRLDQKEQDAAPAAILPFEALPTKQKSSEEQAKTDYYAQFRQVLGSSGPAMATKLLKAKGGNIWQAMSALGAAKESGDIRSYLGAIINRAHDPAEGIHRGL